MSLTRLISSLTLPLATLGLFTMAYYMKHMISFVYLYTFHRGALVPRYLRDHRLQEPLSESATTKPSVTPTEPPEQIERSWALVTGASDGIGKGFAQELCSRGFNVVLHGRNAAKLDRVRQELREDFPHIKTQAMVLDVTHFDITDMQREVERMASLPLTVLVNNVGGVGPVMLDQGDYFPLASYTASQIDGMIDLNARFMSHLTGLLVPVLSRNKPSLIVNVCSLADLGVPYLSLYAACKGFAMVLSRSLSLEFDPRLEDAGIEVLGIQAGEVNSGHNTASVTWNRPSSRVMAKAALDKVGCGRVVVAGYWAHGLMTSIIGVLPEGMSRSMLVQVFKAEVEKMKAANVKRAGGARADSLQN